MPLDQYPDVMEKKNCASFGKGLYSINIGSRENGSNDAILNSLQNLNIMEKHKVIWQTAELGKVDQGGGAS